MDGGNFNQLMFKRYLLGNIPKGVHFKVFRKLNESR
jgi:hypothetical protein